MRIKLMLSLIASVSLIIAAPAANSAPAPRPQFVENVDYWPPESLERRKPYRPPGNSGVIRNFPVIWSWRLELPDGRGLTFGGLSLRTEDPRPPTLIKRDGEWVSIREELRAANPMQAHCDKLRNLRPTLQRIHSLARHIYFEGRTEAEEKAYLEKTVAPLAADLLREIAQTRAAIEKAAKGGDKYWAGQAALALRRLDAVVSAVKGVGARTDKPRLDALRAARVDLEWSTDLLDSEPPGRALSMPAWDAKHGLFVVFGGDHCDYLSNELWTFDPKGGVWRQRHPANPPEPRGDHILESIGDGKLRMRGGYLYWRRLPGWGTTTWVAAGPDEWVYDLGSDAWTGPAGATGADGDERYYRENGGGVDAFTDAPRPDAAEFGKLLAGLPANTWVDLKPPQRPSNRDWGTLALDPDRDMIYSYNGGHAARSGADVLHFHMGTGRWDQLVETEIGPGYNGNGESIPGYSFQRRAWICGHSWNTYGYHPEMKRMIVNGRQGLNTQHVDMNTYCYDPDLGDWERRGRTTKAFDAYSTQVRFIPGLGMITWYGNDFWKLDEETLDWAKLTVTGPMPRARCDFSGMVYDPVRKRQLLFSGGNYHGKPFSGEVFAVSAPGLEATSFTLEGSEHIQALYAGKENSLGVMVLREIAHHPGMDIFLFASKLPGDHMLAMDAKANRWIALKLPGPYSWTVGTGGLVYDSKRDLFFTLGNYGQASAMRLDPKTVEVRTLAEIVAANAKKD